MKRQTITMSVKDARPEKNGDEERKYSFRTIAVDHIQENGNIRQVGDIDDQVRPCDIHDAVLGSVEHILERTYDIDILRKMYSIITFGDPKEAEPVDDEVEDELSRKNAESEHDEEKEGEDE